MNNEENIQKNKTTSNEIVSNESNILFDSTLDFDPTFGFIPFNKS